MSLTEIKGVFLKDLDTFGKMDPYAKFVVNKVEYKTETHENGGREPVWKTPIIMEV